MQLFIGLSSTHQKARIFGRSFSLTSLFCVLSLVLFLFPTYPLQAQATAKEKEARATVDQKKETAEKSGQEKTKEEQEQESEITPASFEDIVAGKKISVKSIDGLIKELQAEIKTLPAPPIPKKGQSVTITPAMQRRTILEKRVAILQRFVEIMTKVENVEKAKTAWAEEAEEIKVLLAELGTKEISRPPESPNIEEFNTIKISAEESTKELESFQKELYEQQELLEKKSETLTKLNEEKQNVEEEGNRFKKMAESKEEGDEKSLLLLQHQNHLLSSQLYSYQIDHLDVEERLIKEIHPFQQTKLDYLTRLEKRRKEVLDNYQAALNKQQEQELLTLENQIVQLERSLEQEEDPLSKLFNQWDLLIAKMEKKNIEDEKLRTELLMHVSEHETQLHEAKNELLKLGSLVEKEEMTSSLSQSLKKAYDEIHKNKTVLSKAIPPSLYDSLELIQKQQAEIASEIKDIPKKLTAELQKLLEDQSEEEKARIESKANDKLSQYNAIASKESALLLEMLNQYKRLQLSIRQQEEIIRQSETLILSSVLWIQDADPISWTTFSILYQETVGRDEGVSLLDWWGELSLAQIGGSLFRAMLGTSFTILFSALVFGLLSGLWMVRYLWQARLHAAESDFPVSYFAFNALTLFLIPAIFWYGAATASAISLPYDSSLMVAALLRHLAVFCVFWAAGRFLFLSDGLGAVLFQMPSEVGDYLHRGIRFGIWSYLILLLPYALFSLPPLQFQAWPRISYLVFIIVLAYLIIVLLRRDSPFIRYVFDVMADKVEDENWGASFLLKKWSKIKKLVLVLVAAVLMMDVCGYHFGASYLLKTTMLSGLTIILLIGLYHLLMFMILKLASSRGGTGEEKERRMEKRREQLEPAARLLCIAALIGTLSVLWGLNETVLQWMETISIYSVSTLDGKLQIVTMGDFFLFLLTIFGVTWLSKNLPNILEFIVFSDTDEGAKYAIFSVIRYTILLIGIFLSLSLLKLDLSKVGWLIAAISVGIGFGLQAILANFISGIILLLEQPMRLGDFITVGGITGFVSNIRMRSTTVLQTNKIEVIVPNRDFITSQFKNYTLSEKMYRLAVHIFVPYNADIDEVTKIFLDKADEVDTVLKTPAPQALVADYTEFGIKFEVRLFIPFEPFKECIMSTQNKFNRAVNAEFKNRGIEFAYPHRRVYIQNERENSLA